MLHTLYFISYFAALYWER